MSKVWNISLQTSPDVREPLTPRHKGHWFMFHSLFDFNFFSKKVTTRVTKSLKLLNKADCWCSQTYKLSCQHSSKHSRYSAHPNCNRIRTFWSVTGQLLFCRFEERCLPKQFAHVLYRHIKLALFLLLLVLVLVFCCCCCCCFTVYVLGSCHQLIGKSLIYYWCYMLIYFKENRVSSLLDFVQSAAWGHLRTKEDNEKWRWMNHKSRNEKGRYLPAVGEPHEAIILPA